MWWMLPGLPCYSWLFCFCVLLYKQKVKTKNLGLPQTLLLILEMQSVLLLNILGCLNPLTYVNISGCPDLSHLRQCPKSQVVNVSGMSCLEEWPSPRSQISLHILGYPRMFWLVPPRTKPTDKTARLLCVPWQFNKSSMYCLLREAHPETMKDLFGLIHDLLHCIIVGHETIATWEFGHCSRWDKSGHPRISWHMLKD